MKDKLKEAFDQYEISDVRSAAIRTAMAEKLARKRRLRVRLTRIAAAAAAVLVITTVLVMVNPSIAQALENVVQAIREQIGLPQDNIVYSNGYLTSSRGPDGSTTTVILGSSPPYLKLIEGKLYFIIDGQITDITDRLSAENPITYSYTGSDGYIHYFAIGGTLGTGENAFRDLVWMQWIWEPTSSENIRSGQLITGGGYGGGMNEDEFKEWMRKVDEAFGDVPFIVS